MVHFIVTGLFKILNNEVLNFGSDKWLKYSTQSYDIMEVSTFLFLQLYAVTYQDNFVGQSKFEIKYNQYEK
jgi:hypothetical protein